MYHIFHKWYLKIILLKFITINKFENIFQTTLPYLFIKHFETLSYSLWSFNKKKSGQRHGYPLPFFMSLRFIILLLH